MTERPKQKREGRENRGLSTFVPCRDVPTFEQYQTTIQNLLERISALEAKFEDHMKQHDQEHWEKENAKSRNYMIIVALIGMVSAISGVVLSKILSY
jgi:hypothetical protein